MVGQWIQEFHHSPSGTISYVVSDGRTHQAIIIDPVADCCIESGEIRFDSADTLLEYIAVNQEMLTSVLTYNLTAHLPDC
ncbi:hypothetical protein ACT31I_000601 [Vibrio cidicii]